MFEFFTNKLSTYIAGFFATAFLITSAITWYVIRDRDIIRLEKDRITTELDMQKQLTSQALDSIQAWKKSAENFQVTLAEASKIHTDAIKENRRLNEVFAEHDLQDLAKKKPSLIAERVNNGANSMLLQIERASTSSEVNKTQ